MKKLVPRDEPSERKFTRRNQEPPDTEPYVRWCERTDKEVTLFPYPPTRYRTSALSAPGNGSTAPARSVPSKTQSSVQLCQRFAPRRSAPLKSQPRRSHPPRSVSSIRQSRKSLFLRSPPLRSIPEKSYPDRSYVVRMSGGRVGICLGCRLRQAFQTVFPSPSGGHPAS